MTYSILFQELFNFTACKTELLSVTIISGRPCILKFNEVVYYLLMLLISSFSHPTIWSAHPPRSETSAFVRDLHNPSVVVPMGIAANPKDE